MKFSRLLFGLLVASLMSCNIFNPSDDVSVDKDDASMLIYEGQKSFRDAEYKSAVNFFESALAADSTRSEAWFGLAKARLYANVKNPLGIVAEINSDENEIPLMNLDEEVAEEYFNAISLALFPLRELVRRDSLTEKNPAIKLSDRMVTYSNFSVSYGMLEFAYTILRFRNSVGSSVKISLNDDKTLSIDVESMYENALNDTAVLNQFNNSLSQLQSDLANTLDNVLPKVSDALEESGMFDGEGSAISQLLGADAAANSQTAKATIGFYKVGDGIDNDGDGCVDEEILDGIDNDGDGLIDEDLRLVPLERAPDSTVSWIGIGRDSLDHDLNGVKEDSLELHLNEKNKLLFAVDFEPKKSNDSTYQANLRAIMEDTDSTKIKYPLKERQRLIGRCWNNYTEKEFKAWFRNR